MLKKTLLILFALCATSLSAQTIVHINPQTQSFIIANAPFKQFQTGAYRYVFPVNPNASMLFSAFATGGSTDNLTANFACTADQTDPGTIATTNQWQFYAPNVTTSITSNTFALPLPLLSSNNAALLSFSSGAPSQFFVIPATGASQCYLNLSSTTSGTDTVKISANFSTANPFINTSSSDPCQTMTKFSVPINIVAATTTLLVTAAAQPQEVFVCGMLLTQIGASQTFQFESGGGATCATSTALLTGAMGGSTSVNDTVPISSAATLFQVTASSPNNNLCLVTTGATVSLQGVVTYVIR